MGATAVAVAVAVRACNATTSTVMHQDPLKQRMALTGVPLGMKFKTTPNFESTPLARVVNDDNILFRTCGERRRRHQVG